MIVGTNGITIVEDIFVVKLSTETCQDFIILIAVDDDSHLEERKVSVGKINLRFALFGL